MEGKQRLRVVVCFVAVGLVFGLTLPVVASPEGEVAASLVTVASYRHILDDMLYTHDGNDRGACGGADHAAARANMISLMFSYGLTVTVETFSFYGCTGYNVVGTKLGSEYPDQEYIVGAHYDSVDNPGADDNASGTAAVLEAARVLSPYPSDYTIRFIAFDAEEWGLLGSEAYVDDHLADDILGMISADMVAYNGNEGAGAVDIYGFNESYPHKLAVAQAVSTYGRGVTPYVVGQLCGSDHCPFENAGFQACLLIEDWGNPYYHQSGDSVDTPNYIDYEFAANNTRAVVGFLVDHAVVHVLSPDGDYDADGDVDLNDYAVFEACFSGSGVPPDPGCEFFDFLSDSDVDCDDWSLFAAVWTGPPTEPPTFWRCVILPAEVAGESNRCFSVTPPEHGLPMALLVTGDSGDPAVSCLSRYVQSSGRLGSTPVFQTFDVWGTVLVCDESVLPSTRYSVQCDYGEPGSPVLSAAAPAVTARWGDTVGEFVGGQWMPANGNVNFNDIAAVVDKFKDLPTAPPIIWVDLVGGSGDECTPNLVIDFSDISAAVDAFKGVSYAGATSCPNPCD
jgi:hypothetical protein